jgi:hypothetical protein
MHTIWYIGHPYKSNMAYQEMTNIERARQQQDLLYHIIINTEATTLNEICEQIKKHAYERYGTDKMSKRLQVILNNICQNKDRCAKHALVFFALRQEPIIRNIFIADTPRVPPEKFKYFIEQELPTLLEKLAKGAFTSLRAFVEDVRWTYTTL